MGSTDTEWNRRNFLAYSATGTAVGALTGLAQARMSRSDRGADQAAERPKCLFFDVNETLLDLGAMKASVAEALGGRAELLPLWFATMLQYSLVATVGGKYDDFGVIGAAAMRMVARNHGIELSEQDALQSMSPIRSLPPHPDVAPALMKLKEAGFRMVTLTNSSNAGVEAQMRNAGLMEMFEERLSIEDIGLYKPHTHAYRWAARRVGLRAQECMLVAAHGWDIAGALWAGWRGAFLSRPGAQLYPLADAPEIVAPTLSSAVDLLCRRVIHSPARAPCLATRRQDHASFRRPMMPYPRTFSHIGLSVPDVDKAVEFYREVMGWYLIMKPTVIHEESETAIGKMCQDVFGKVWGSFKIAHMSTGDRVGIEMFEFSSNERPGDFEYWKTGTFHFSVQDPDVEGLVEKIVAHGGKQRMPIREYYPGEKPYRMVYVEDPFGLIFEIYSHSYELTYSQGAWQGQDANTGAPPGLGAVEDWIPETIELPPGFAPDWPAGTEMLLFPPGWRDPGSEAFWSYAIVAWIDEPQPDGDRVAELVESYYNGLMSAFGVGREGRAHLPVRVELETAGERAYRGTMRLTDGFATFKPIEVSLRIETRPVDGGRSAISLRASPQGDAHAIWEALGNAVEHIRVQRAFAEASGPLDGILGRLVPGEWRLGVMNGSVQVDRWRWGAGRRSLIGHTLNSKGDGESTSGVLRVIYRHPTRKETMALAISRGGLVWEGAVTPGDERVVFDMTLDYADGLERAIMYEWAFESPDRYRTSWMMDGGERVPPGTTDWLYLRAEERPAPPEDPAGVSEAFAGLEQIIGRAWESGDGARVSFDWVRHAEVLHLRAVESEILDGEAPEYDAFVYAHPGHGGLRYLAVWATGRVDEGDARVGADGLVELEYDRLEAGGVTRGAGRFELTGDGSYRQRVWRIEAHGLELDHVVEVGVAIEIGIGPASAEPAHQVEGVDAVVELVQVGSGAVAVEEGVSVAVDGDASAAGEGGEQGGVGGGDVADRARDGIVVAGRGAGVGADEHGRAHVDRVAPVPDARGDALALERIDADQDGVAGLEEVSVGSAELVGVDVLLHNPPEAVEELLVGVGRVGPVGAEAGVGDEQRAATFEDVLLERVDRGGGVDGVVRAHDDDVVDRQVELIEADGGALRRAMDRCVQFQGLDALGDEEAVVAERLGELEPAVVVRAG
eukprot:g5861.t1